MLDLCMGLRSASGSMDVVDGIVITDVGSIMTVADGVVGAGNE
jgi:hypothetical protein